MTDTTAGRASIVAELVKLASQNIKRSQTDFLGRMTEALCQYAERFEDNCDMTDDDKEEAAGEVSELAGLALAQWAMLVSDAPITALTPDAIQTREAELVAALKPFADLAQGEVWKRFIADGKINLRISNGSSSAHYCFINAECFETARAALNARGGA